MRGRMEKRKLDRVQQMTRGPRPQPAVPYRIAVRPVADDGTAEFGGVDADLVHASCLDSELDE